MLTMCYVLNRVPNKKSKTIPYELWFKKFQNLRYIRIRFCRTEVKLPESKRILYKREELISFSIDMLKIPSHTSSML